MGIDKLIDLLVGWIKLLRLFVIVPPYESVIMLRWGKVHRNRPGGLHWVIPFDVDRPHIIPKYLQTMIVGPQSLATKDNVEIVVSTLVTFQVTNDVTYFISINGGEQAISDIAHGIVAKYVMEHTWTQLRDGEMERILVTRMRARGVQYGVRIATTQIVDLTRSRSYRIINGASRGMKLGEG